MCSQFCSTDSNTVFVLWLYWVVMSSHNAYCPKSVEILWELEKNIASASIYHIVWLISHLFLRLQKRNLISTRPSYYSSLKNINMMLYYCIIHSYIHMAHQTP